MIESITPHRGGTLVTVVTVRRSGWLWRLLRLGPSITRRQFWQRMSWRENYFAGDWRTFPEMREVPYSVGHRLCEAIRTTQLLDRMSA